VPNMVYHFLYSDSRPTLPSIIHNSSAGLSSVLVVLLRHPNLEELLHLDVLLDVAVVAIRFPQRGAVTLHLVDSCFPIVSLVSHVAHFSNASEKPYCKGSAKLQIVHTTSS